MLKAFEKATTQTQAPKSLDEVCEIYMKFAENAMAEDGTLGLFAIIGMKNNDGTVANLMCPLLGEMGDKRREVLFELGKKFAIDSIMGYFTSIDYVGMVSEAWMSSVDKADPSAKKYISGESVPESMMPRNDPKKKEAVIVFFTDGKHCSQKTKEIVRAWNPELDRIVMHLEDRTPEQAQSDADKSLKGSVLWSFYEAYNDIREDAEKTMPADIKKVADAIKIKNLNRKINYAQFQKEESERGGKKFHFANLENI